jgi:hypothetical protein
VFKNALAVLLTALLVLPVQGGQQTSPTIEKQVGQLQHKKTSPGLWVLAIAGGAVLVLVIIGSVVASK